MASINARALREPYSTTQQQRDTATLGMWVFLATEVMFFGGLFAAFAIYRMYYTQGFLEGSRGMTLVIGSVNTAVLLTSSLTMNLAGHSISQGRQHRCYWLLLLTAFIGMVFLSLKFTEYVLHYQDRKVPGIWFESHQREAGPEQLFYVFYFAMTGLHVIHLSIGVGLVIVTAVRVAMGRFNSDYHTQVDNVGVYWHFVDIIWNFLFAIFYIPGFR